MNAGAREEHRFALEHLLALSNIMLESARRQEWDEVTRCEGVRRQAIDALFAEPLRGGLSADLIAPAIEQLLQRDREVARLAVARREALAESARQISLGKEAMRAYAEIK